VLTVGAWHALAFGLVEGLLLNLARFWPPVLAPYKASAHVLWVAPLVDLATFGLFGVGVFLLLRAWRTPRLSPLLLVWGAFAFLGMGTVAATLNVIHYASAALLGLGGSVAVCRFVAGRESTLTSGLRRWLILVPLTLLAVGGGVALSGAAGEAREFGRLPPVSLP
jgi:hypothetical protein